MIRINLSPKKVEKKKEFLRIQFWVFGLLLTLALVVCLWLYTGMAGKIDTLRQQRDRIQAEGRKLAKVVALSKSITEQRARIEEKVKSIRKLDEKRDLPYRLLAALQNVLIRTENTQAPGIGSAQPVSPLTKRVSLVTLEMTGNRIVIKGFATDNTTITQYIKRLKNLKIGDVDEAQAENDVNLFQSVQLGQSELTVVPVSWDSITISGERTKLTSREFTGTRRVIQSGARVELRGIKRNQGMEDYFKSFAKDYRRQESRLVGYAETMRKEFARKVMKFEITLLVNDRLTSGESDLSGRSLMSYCDTPACEERTPKKGKGTNP